MIEKIIRNLHIFVLIYGALHIHNEMGEFDSQLQREKARTPVLQRNKKKAEKAKKQLAGYVDKKEVVIKEIESVAAEVETLQRQLPADVSDPENLSLLKKLAEAINIKNIFLAPGKEDDKGFYIVKNYEFRGSGTFLQFLLLFEQISRNERLLNINEVILTKMSTPQRGRFQIINAQIQIGAFKYNPKFKESRGIEEIEQESQMKKGKKKARKRKPRRKT